MVDPVAQKCESDTEKKKARDPYGPLDLGKMMHTDEVLARTGWSRTTLWRRVRAGEFPAPVKTGPNSVDWFDDEVDEAQEKLARVDYAPEPEAA